MFFQYHVAVAQMWGEMARNYADSLIIPINLTYYSENLVAGVDRLQAEYSEEFASSTVMFAATLGRHVFCS